MTFCPCKPPLFNSKAKEPFPLTKLLETPSLIPCRSLFSNPKSLLGKMVESNIYVLAKFALAKEIIFPFFS